MKYLFISILFLTGCTVSNDQALMEELRDVKYELQSCKNTVAAQSTSGFDTASTLNPEPEPQPVEPQCEDVDYFTVYQDNKLVATCREAQYHECGVNANYCTNGFTYNCLTNVKLGSETKKICE